MSFETYLALLLFSFVSTITPGPNNAMAMASGANFGVWRTLPHMLGITIGFTVMILLIGVGLMGLFEAFPVVDRILTVVSVVYLVWLAWKIATAAPKLPDAPETAGKPFSFFQAAAFQWVNPKAWSMAVYAITRFATAEDGSRSLFAVSLVALSFCLVSMPSIASWTLLGQQMRRFLTSQARLRGFNITMAVLLVLTSVPVVFPQWFASSG